MCAGEIKDVRSQLTRLSSLLEKYVGSNEQILTHIQNSITEVKTQMNEIKLSNEQTTNILRDNITEMKTQISDIKSSSNNIAAEQNNIKTHVAQKENKLALGDNKIHEIERELKNLIHPSSIQPSGSASCPEGQQYSSEVIIREVKDRNAREKNVKLVGIPESTSSNAEERMWQDETAVHTITNAVNPDILKPIKILRIGKYVAGKYRRMKICYETTRPAKLLLSNKDKLPKDIKIFSDQTPAQHKYYK